MPVIGHQAVRSNLYFSSRLAGEIRQDELADGVVEKRLMLLVC